MMRRSVLSLTILVLAVSSASAQTSKGFQSFHEMLDAKDAGILSTINEQFAYVCAVNGKRDAFVTVAFSVPAKTSFRCRNEGCLSKDAFGDVTATYFSDGTVDQTFQGTSMEKRGWVLFGNDENPQYFGSSAVVTLAEIDDSEISFDPAAGVEQNRVFIRRSTGRFVFVSQSGHQTTGRCEIYNHGKLVGKQ